MAAALEKGSAYENAAEFSPEMREQQVLGAKIATARYNDDMRMMRELGAAPRKIAVKKSLPKP